jgi:hypothetical protein
MTSNLQETNTNNNLSGENNMNTTDNLISALITHFTDNPQNFTDYRKNIESILRENIKPISSRSGKNSGGDSWRKELKQRFSGRGAKWVFVSLENIESSLSALELEGIDCSDYRKNINKLGKAWIRFSGSRINDGIKCAAFEVRTGGSTIDHPKQLHLIYIDGLDDVIETMPGTPKGLKIEEESAPMPSKPKVKKVKPVASNKSELDMLAQEINVELNESPDSNDPEDWEAFLAAEGLIDDDIDLL